MVIKNIPLTSFVKFFGRNTRMKVMDFLIENRRTSWNKTEIMYHAKVGHTCLLEILKDLTNLRIIQIEKGKYFLNKKKRGFHSIFLCIYSI